MKKFRIIVFILCISLLFVKGYTLRTSQINEFVVDNDSLSKISLTSNENVDIKDLKALLEEYNQSITYLKIETAEKISIYGTDKYFEVMNIKVPEKNEIHTNCQKCSDKKTLDGSKFNIDKTVEIDSIKNLDETIINKSGILYTEINYPDNLEFMTDLQEIGLENVMQLDEKNDSSKLIKCLFSLLLFIPFITYIIIELIDFIKNKKVFSLQYINGFNEFQILKSNYLFKKVIYCLMVLFVLIIFIFVSHQYHRYTLDPLITSLKSTVIIGATLETIIIVGQFFILESCKNINVIKGDSSGLLSLVFLNVLTTIIKLVSIISLIFLLLAIPKSFDKFHEFIYWENIEGYAHVNNSIYQNRITMRDVNNDEDYSSSLSIESDEFISFVDDYTEGEYIYKYKVDDFDSKNNDLLLLNKKYLEMINFKNAKEIDSSVSSYILLPGGIENEQEVVSSIINYLEESNQSGESIAKSAQLNIQSDEKYLASPENNLTPEIIHYDPSFKFYSYQPSSLMGEDSYYDSPFVYIPKDGCIDTDTAARLSMSLYYKSPTGDPIDLIKEYYLKTEPELEFNWLYGQPIYLFDMYGIYISSVKMILILSLVLFFASCCLYIYFISSIIRMSIHINAKKKMLMLTNGCSKYKIHRNIYLTQVCHNVVVFIIISLCGFPMHFLIIIFALIFDIYLLSYYIKKDMEVMKVLKGGVWS